MFVRHCQWTRECDFDDSTMCVAVLHPAKKPSGVGAQVVACRACRAAKRQRRTAKRVRTAESSKGGRYIPEKDKSASGARRWPCSHVSSYHG